MIFNNKRSNGSWYKRSKVQQFSLFTVTDHANELDLWKIVDMYAENTLRRIYQGE